MYAHSLLISPLLLPPGIFLFYRNLFTCFLAIHLTLLSAFHPFSYFVFLHISCPYLPLSHRSSFHFVSHISYTHTYLSKEIKNRRTIADRKTARNSRPHPRRPRPLLPRKQKQINNRLPRPRRNLVQASTRIHRARALRSPDPTPELRHGRRRPRCHEGQDRTIGEGGPEHRCGWWVREGG